MKITKYLKNHLKKIRQFFIVNLFCHGIHQYLSSGHKPIVVIPSGRKETMQILVKYLLCYRDEVDQVHLWINTTNPSDIKYLYSLEKKYPNYFKTVKCETTPNGVKTIGTFFKHYMFPGQIYIRLDDDIVYIEKGTLQELAQYKRDNNKKYFLIYPNIINNSLCTYLHQQSGCISESNGRATWNTFCKFGWGPQGSITAHQAFQKDLLQNQIDKWKFPSLLMLNNKSTINCICWSGEDFLRVRKHFILNLHNQEKEYWKSDEEEWLAVELPKNIKKHNVIYGTKIVSHFSYYSQERNSPKMVTILKKYLQIANKL